MPDYEALKFWLALANSLGIVIVSIYTWWCNRNRATAAAHDALQQRVSHCEHQIGERLRLSDLEDLYETMNKMNRELGEVSAKLSGLTHQVQLYQEYVLKREARA